MTDLFSLQDKVAHVSGGSRGIGLAIAKALAEAGARVFVSARNEKTLQASGFEYEVCDVADADQIRRSVDRIEAKAGRIDILFNVAGINFRHAAETFPIEKLDQIFAVNIRGNFLMAGACAGVMMKHGGGKIVNIASLHTHESLPGVAAYGASKGSIASMTRALAVEWAPFHIQVNAIAPGFIRTDLNATLWEDKELREWVERRTPAARLGEPRDVVGAAIFLASGGSDFVTGQVLYVDGGFTAGSDWPLKVPR